MSRKDYSSVNTDINIESVHPVSMIKYNIS